MALEWNLTHVLGLSAAALIVALGAFVLAARPHAVATRAFFVFALFDGVSSALFELRDMATLPSEQTYFYSTFYYFFVASIAMLLGFGLVFPRPVVPPRWRAPLVVALLVATLAVLFAYTVNHAAFVTVTVTGGRAVFGRAAGGKAVRFVLLAVIAFVTLKLTRDFLRGPGDGYRRQAAFVLAGLIVGYGYIPVVTVAEDLSLHPGVYVSRDLTQLAVSWSFVLASILVLGAAARVALADSPFVRERRFVGGAALLVVLLGVLEVAAPSAGNALQIFALIVYPLLLGFAILRYAVFDIHAHVRRAVVLSAATLGAGAAFVLVQNAVQSIIQSKLESVASQWVAGTIAALVAAAAFLPVARVARRFLPDLAPAGGENALHSRRLEIYRHSVEGAAADGLLDILEHTVLRRLRESLGISADEDATIVREVRARVIV